MNEPDYKAMWEELKETLTHNKRESENAGANLLRDDAPGFAIGEVEIAFGCQMALGVMEQIEAKTLGLDEEED